MDRDLREELAGSQDGHWWFEGRRRIIADVLSRHGAGSPLAEIGCGGGANLDMLARFGTVTGVEPDPADRRHAAERGTATVLSGSLPDQIPLKAGSCNTVLALDVIEHVADDEAAVATLRDLLAPGGLLVITVPANPWLWSVHDTRNGHFRRYTRRGLSQLLRDADVRILELSHFNFWLLPVIAFVRWAGRVVGMDGAGTSAPPGPVNAVLMKLLASESRLLARFALPAGVSLIAVATRP